MTQLTGNDPDYGGYRWTLPPGFAGALNAMPPDNRVSFLRRSKEVVETMLTAVATCTDPAFSDLLLNALVDQLTMANMQTITAGMSLADCGQTSCRVHGVDGFVTLARRYASIIDQMKTMTPGSPELQQAIASFDETRFQSTRTQVKDLIETGISVCTGRPA